MRGSDQSSGSMFSYVSLEDRIPSNHPLCGLRPLVDEALHDMSRLFDEIYGTSGRL